MDSIFTYILYGVMIILLIISFVKSKKKTLQSLKRALKMFIKVLPQFVAILLLVGLSLAVISPETIQHVIGTESGFLGMLICAALGTIVVVPAMIAFPIAAELLGSGAGIAQIVVFVSTLTTVGFVTLPLEARYLGKKLTIIRNTLSFLLAFVVAYIMGAILI